MEGIIDIRGIKAKRGEKKAGYFPIVDCDGNKSYVPVFLVNGHKEGSTLCLTAGVHGCEYTSIEAAIRIYQETDPLDLHGTIIGIPVLNVEGFRQRKPYVSPWDGKNINRIFPGKPNGTISEVLADFIIDQVIPKSNYHIDLHGGDMSEFLDPYVIVSKPVDDEAMFKRILQFAQHFLPPVIIISEPGRGRSYSNVMEKGVPSMLAEAGENGLLDEKGLNFLVRGIQNVMRHLDMLSGNPETPPINIQYASAAQSYYSSQEGLFYPIVKAGDIVNKGQKVGELRDYFGNVIEELKAPNSGYISFLVSSISILQDGLLMGIAPLIGNSK